MIKKLSLILITTLALNLNASAGSDGNLVLKKNEPSEVKDCFERINRATFKLNQSLDGIVFKPSANVYRKLPSPARTGVSNSLENLSHLTTIPNNILQGDFKQAGVNTSRFVINTTLGILNLSLIFLIISSMTCMILPINSGIGKLITFRSLLAASAIKEHK